MPGWIIAAAVGSIVITALLTFVLWRMNAPLLAQAKQERADLGASDGGSAAVLNGNSYADIDGTDGGSDGGGDGGGGD